MRALPLILCTAFVLVGCAAPAADQSATPTAESGPPEVDISDLGAESLEVEPFADFAISSGDLVWVSGIDPGIVAYDSAMSPVFQVPTGTVWAALDFGHGYVWAAETENELQANTIVRIDPESGEATRFAVPAPGIPPEASIAVTEDAVWGLIASSPWKIVGLDPATGAVLRTFDLGGDSVAAVRGGFGSLWITRPAGILERLDAVTGETVAEIQLHRAPTFISVGPDAVWVMDQLGTVFRVDPETNEVVATIEANPNGIIGGDIAASADAVWVQGNSLLGIQIDPSTNEVVQRVGPREGSGSVAITDDGAVWITAHDAFTLYRIPPG